MLFMRTGCFVKLLDKRTGWYGEGCWAAHGKRFIKRLEHRYNRRAQKKLLRNSTLNVNVKEEE